MCGERWGRDHQCKQEVQLHVVQEMVQFLQHSEMSDPETDDASSEVHMISAAALGDTSDKPVQTMKFRVQLQGHNLIFLLDSGSTHFLY